jgi:hypothetical protein
LGCRKDPYKIIPWIKNCSFATFNLLPDQDQLVDAPG